MSGWAGGPQRVGRGFGFSDGAPLGAEVHPQLGSSEEYFGGFSVDSVIVFHGCGRICERNRGTHGWTHFE